jgi:hypothetical protein
MWQICEEPYLAHHGIKGQKWGVRRWQNEDGTLTEEGKRKYGTVENFNKAQKRKKIARGVAIGAGATVGTAAIATAVILGKQRIENMNLQKITNKNIDDMAKEIEDDKTALDYWIKESDISKQRISDLESQRPKMDKIYSEYERHKENATRKWLPDPNSATRYYGVRSWQNHPENPLNKSRGYGAKATYEYYKEDEKANKANNRYGKWKNELDRAKSKKLSDDYYLRGAKNDLESDRMLKNDYVEWLQELKEHPFRTKSKNPRYDKY